MKPKVKLIITAIILLFVVVMAFTVKVNVAYDNESLTVGAPFAGKVVISIKNIESIELLGDIDYGYRSFGVGLPWVSVGKFDNSEFGSYRLYANTGCGSNIVVRYPEGVLVFNRKTAEETKKIYEDLKTLIGG